jgi:maltooligosyltrehalose trehalohydrolase
MRRAHAMPFGAVVADDGQVQFRLWAPAAGRVEVCIERPEGELRLPMQPEAGGWFEMSTASARAGSRYRYCIDGGLKVPDPASRFQPEDIHGPSEVVDPRAHDWRDSDWRGRPWEEAVFYELHIGAFTPEGTFAAAIAYLDELVALGVTVIELMPVADFPGERNWGYDGVLPFAPDSRYGTPGDLKALVDAAHARGLMIFLDVVYNHFGPEGNYLHHYAPAFFSERHHTPWGTAINFDGPACEPVRAFHIHNALYWLEEYHFDGLRLDAVHAIIDESNPDILEEIAASVRRHFGRDREVHLVLENDANQSRYLRPARERGNGHYDAQWNDDLHHALHVIVTGESGGYYEDYVGAPLRLLGRALAEGFAWQGEPSAWRDGALRGEPSGFLPPTAFVSFLQNHDQIGNRAFGERIAMLASPEAVRAASAILLLAPAPPLLFMGQEWGSLRPFLFFCDFGPDLAAQITAGRRREFAAFPAFATDELRERIPDPCAASTFDACRLDRREAETDAGHAWLAWHRRLLALRRDEIMPRLSGAPGGSAAFESIGAAALRVDWRLGDGSRLTLLANLQPAPAAVHVIPQGRCLYRLPEDFPPDMPHGQLPAWSVAWYLEEAPA